MYGGELKTYNENANNCKSNNGDVLTFWDDMDVDYCLKQNLPSPGFYVSYCIRAIKIYQIKINFKVSSNLFPLIRILCYGIILYNNPK
jgi:hypothetical protein